MTWTADLCDEHGDEVALFDAVFSSYGGRDSYAGPVTTLSVFEDNVLVRTTLEEPGRGRVLLVGGGFGQVPPCSAATSACSPSRMGGPGWSWTAVSAITESFGNSRLASTRGAPAPGRAKRQAWASATCPSRSPGWRCSPATGWSLTLTESSSDAPTCLSTGSRNDLADPSPPTTLGPTSSG